jgi:TonB family protein
VRDTGTAAGSAATASAECNRRHAGSAAEAAAGQGALRDDPERGVREVGARPLDRWHDAMTSYRSGLYRSGLILKKQEPLGTRAVPFAYYLNATHNRLHVWFADRFLVSLDKLPKDDPMNNRSLRAKVEVGIAPDGHIAQIGLLQSSGLPLFDASALEAFARAAPFEATPEALRSSDGNVWIHWELLRDDVVACSTMHVQPFILGSSFLRTWRGEISHR